MLFDLQPRLRDLLAEHVHLREKAHLLARDVHFSVSTRTVGGVNLRSFSPSEHAHGTSEFMLDAHARETTTAKLRALGFKIHNQGWFDIHVSGTAELVTTLIGERLTLQLANAVRPIEERTDWTRVPSADELFLAPSEQLMASAHMLEDVDCFFIPPPENLAAAPAPNAVPPSPKYHHINSSDIRRLLNVPSDAKGDNIVVALVDTGFFRHPYYVAQKYDYCPKWAPPPNLPDDDPVGHGTAIALNLFAVAPNVKMYGYVHGQVPHMAIQRAVNDGADIVSCSWGWANATDAIASPVVAATISHAVNALNKIVIFASGNGPDKYWPASMPEIISVGGVYWNPKQQFEASNYASGFVSDTYPGRIVPDVCGLCGQMPKGVYIMLPCSVGSGIDADNFAAGAPFPKGDGLPQNDGWAGTSGTSSAAPQIAGVVALLLQKAKLKKVMLKPKDVRAALQSTATPVGLGANAHNFAASAQLIPNPAVGYGIVNAKAALAKV